MQVEGENRKTNALFVKREIVIKRRSRFLRDGSWLMIIVGECKYGHDRFIGAIHIIHTGMLVNMFPRVYSRYSWW